MRQAFIDPHTGIALPFDMWTLDDAQDFYTRRSKILEEYLTIKYPNYPDSISYAMSKNSEIDQFTLFYGFGSNALDYLSLLVFIVVMICSILFAPVFSGDYQSGADDVLRCAKRGRTELGIAKVASTNIFAILIYLVCTLIYLTITVSVFGVDSLRTSMQMVFTSISFWPITIGEVVLFVIISGALSMFAMISFTLLLSSIFRNPSSTLGISVGACLLPLVFYVTGSGSFVDWIRLLLPSGGIGLQNSFLYELFNSSLLTIGTFGVWSPFINPILCSIEIVLFPILTIGLYNSHEAA